MVRYELRTLDLPRLTGPALAGVAAALELAPTRALLLPRLLAEGGLLRLRRTDPGVAPLTHPSWPATASGEAAAARAQPAAGMTAPDGLEDAGALTAAYRAGRVTPTEVVERALAALEADGRADQPVNAFLRATPDEARALAAASATRYASGVPLGPLDGVPVAVKDELDQRGAPTTVGTAFLGTRPASADSTAVARLRAAGAVLLGKTNMHELGINPTGANVTYGLVRNPHRRGHDSGGSSSGSAAAVAAGYCPLAVGADGGGSVRIPAALCGVVGLKATWGRISEHGAAGVCWSVAHVGPIGRTVRDVALGLAIMGGPDPQDPTTLSQPSLTLDALASFDPRGKKIGVYPDWLEDASPAAVAAAKDGLAALEAAGAHTVEVAIPELEEARIAHAATILTEMAAAMRVHAAKDRALAPSTRISLAIGRAMSGVDYVQAQRIRARLFAHMEAALAEVDAIATPATAIAAPALPVASAHAGWSDLATVTELMRFAFPANLTGHPALTVPVGDDGGLPLGLQLIGRAWDEATLLGLGRVVERASPAIRPRGATTLLS